MQTCPRVHLVTATPFPAICSALAPIRCGRSTFGGPLAAKPNAPLKQGDLLFRIDPRPYQFIVDQKKALLADAEQNVKQLKSALDQAMAGVGSVPGLMALQVMPLPAVSTATARVMPRMAVLVVT